jgi:hypothetical protein
MWVFMLHENIRPVRFTQSSRRHRLGRARIVEAMESAHPLPHGPEDERRYVWWGRDGRGLDIEVIAVDHPDYLLVIHDMPLSLRRRRRRGDA